MKTTTILLAIMIGFISLVQSQNNKGLEDGLVAYYPFNGNAIDESGNGYDGTPSNSYSYVSGNNNFAIRLQGIGNTGSIGGHVLIPMLDFNGMSEFSISLWVNEEGMSYNHGEAYIWYGDHTSGHIGISHLYSNVEFSVGDANISMPFDDDYLNSWINYCITFDNGILKAFKDGVFLDSDTGTINITDLTAAIGRHWWSGGNGTSTRFIGSVDEVRIYNRALSDEEVNSLYKATPFALTVFLEGAYNDTDMNTDLNPSPLPLSQPYNDPLKWNYQGTESVTAIPNLDIVDWILVEIRETSSTASTAIADSMIARQAAFLLKNGSIVGLDGINPIQFYCEITDSIYVVIYHRNHLSMMSSGPLAKTTGVYSWDFTTSLDQAYGTDAQIDLGGVFGMIGGDCDASGFIDMDDKDIDWSNNAGKAGYYLSDLNMDSEIDNQDKNEIWEPNFGKTSQLPVPCGVQIVDARDGQSYNTIQIGNQCWMAENLNIGNRIDGSYNQNNNSIIEKYCYNNNTNNCDTYGGLYQWDEMMQYVSTEGTQGICPDGWHLPTDAEYRIVEIELGMSALETSNTGWRGTDEGAKLAGNEPLWTNGNLDLNANFDASAFMSIPGGYRSISGSSEHLSNVTFFWSSSENGGNAWIRHLHYNYTQIYRYYRDQAYGFSVRCIRD